MQRYDLVLKNGTIVTPEQSYKADIAVKDGKIVSTGKLTNPDAAEDIYDAEGKHILPGIIDAHVHFRDPGLTLKEDFESGSMAAAFGGVTTVADMPNVIPVTATADCFCEKVSIAKEKSYVDFALFALLTNDNTNEIEGIKNAGAIGFKVYLGNTTGDIAAPGAGVMIEQMIAAAELGMRVGFHAETNDLNTHFTSLCRKVTNAFEGLLLSNARPVISEVMAIQAAITYAQYTKAKIHIHHVTSFDGVQLIAEAKRKGISITTETCPHYLLLDANKTVQKVYPPIRDEWHRKCLWEALSRGTIDMIATDHAPHTFEEKNRPLWEAPAGLTGVETFVPLMLNEVNKGNLTLNEFVRYASEMPAKVWNIFPRKGSLQAGADADFTIVDMGLKKTIKKNELHSKSKTSPFDKTEVQGIPVSTIIRGKFVMKDCKLTGDRGFGELISPAL